MIQGASEIIHLYIKAIVLMECADSFSLMLRFSNMEAELDCLYNQAVGQWDQQSSLQTIAYKIAVCLLN